MKQGVVAIIGLGLIGGSLALALKAYTDCQVHGFDACAAELQQAAAAGAVDVAAPSIAAAVAAADIVVFCLPVTAIPAAVKQALPALKAGAIITDVASTKGYLLETIPALLPPWVCYIGAHPMTGSEKSGFAAAHAGLFKNKHYVLTKQSEQDTAAIEKLKVLITAIGAIPIVIDGDIHDEVVAEISHLPHVAAAALTILASGGKAPELNLLLAAGGFRDMTRVAASNPKMWVDICMTNREKIVACLRQFHQQLGQIIHSLECGDEAAITDFFVKAKSVRDVYSQKNTFCAEVR